MAFFRTPRISGIRRVGLLGALALARTISRRWLSAPSRRSVCSEHQSGEVFPIRAFAASEATPQCFPHLSCIQPYYYFFDFPVADPSFGEQKFDARRSMARLPTRPKRTIRVYPPNGSCSAARWSRAIFLTISSDLPRTDATLRRDAMVLCLLAVMRRSDERTKGFRFCGRSNSWRRSERARREGARRVRASRGPIFLVRFVMPLHRLLGRAQGVSETESARLMSCNPF